MPSSHPENSEEPSGLLRTLAAVFSGVLFGMLLSKFRAPIQKTTESIRPEDTPEEENRYRNAKPATISQIPPSPSQNAGTNGSKDSTPLWKKFLEWVALLTAIGLLVVNIFQLQLTREQVHAGQRAYLIFHHAVLEGELKTDQGIAATLDLTNSGLTPAKNVSYFIELDVLPGYPVSISYPAQVDSAAPIGANGKLTVFAQIVTKLSADDVKEISADYLPVLEGNRIIIPNGKRLYLRAIARYETVFGSPGEAEYCAVYVKSMNQFIGCPTHNTLK